MCNKKVDQKDAKKIIQMISVLAILHPDLMRAQDLYDDGSNNYSDIIIHFESPEHQKIGEKLLLACDTSNPGERTLSTDSKCGIKLDGDIPTNKSYTWPINVTFGDIIFLAGDLYAIPDEPIASSKDYWNNTNVKNALIKTDEINRFEDNFATLYGKNSSWKKYRSDIDQVFMKNKINPAFEIPQFLNLTSTARAELDRLKEMCTNESTEYDINKCMHDNSNIITDQTCDFFEITNNGSRVGCIAGVPISKLIGLGSRYIAMAENNTDHFGYEAIRSYIIAHSMALKTAKEAYNHLNNNDLFNAGKYLNLAYAKPRFQLQVQQNLIPYQKLD